MSDPQNHWRHQWRRWVLLVLGIGAVSAGLYAHLTDSANGGERFAANSMLRVGIVLIALWLALPTLKKPLRWVPPGVAALCLLGIGAVAAQPRLIFVIGPAAGVLLAIGGFARFFRRPWNDRNNQNHR